MGRLSKRELVDSIDKVVRYTAELTEFAQTHHLELRFEARVAGGTQKVPTHVVVPDIDAAASVAGRPARARLARARNRSAILADAFPSSGSATIAKVVARCDDASDVDFDLLVRAALWFSEHDAAGLTPRQVPLEGFHAKWLDSAGRRTLISLLCGKESLGLSGRPARVDFAYLDPLYLAGGNRRYDSYVIGDASELPYAPSVAVIVENKDTYLRFPPLEGGVCIFGGGSAGSAHVRMLPWINEVDRLLYWGDMDTDGFAILDGYREGGLEVASILMDMRAYRRYERFGTSLAIGPQQLADRRTCALEHLNASERELYDYLADPDCPTARRIEQERIPLAHALEAIS